MSPATWPRSTLLAERLLWIDPAADAHADAGIADLPKLVRPGDLLVVNDAATLPASLHGTWGDGAEIELRLLARHVDDSGAWSAVLFGRGSFRTRTEDREPPPPVAAGDALRFGDLGATVIALSPRSRRLVEVRFDAEGAALFAALYRVGRPVQYAHVAAPLSLWHTQTCYAARPWSVETPSAGRPLTWGLLLELARRGVRTAAITHAAGLSSTGDPAIDALLPLPERYEVPLATVTAIQETRAAGGRIIAVGTSVVRALEGRAAALGGELSPGDGVTDLRIGRASRLAVVDGLLTGLHEPEASHFELLQAFAPRALLERAYAHAEQAGYLGHEFGDSNLILRA